MKKTKQHIKWSAALLLSLLLLSGLAIKLELGKSIDNRQIISLEVAADASLHSVLKTLQRQNHIQPYQRYLLIAFTKISGETAIRRGLYEIAEQTSLLALHRQLYNGKVKRHYVTLIEGKTYADMLQRLKQQPNLTIERDSWQLNTQLIEGFEGTNYEGLIYPDTYAYQHHDSVNSIVQRAYRQMVTVLMQEWRGRAPNLPYKTPYQVLIMASIIERETAIGVERPKIAGVFVRRLQKGMKLQTDPTIIYGLGKDFDGDLKSVHLRTANPYNSYMNFGLPPTPIALAGRAAINAALHPEPGNSLYFVAKGDGSHHFSASLEEHQRAVRYYQIDNRAGDYRSSPKPSSKPSSKQ